VAASLALGAGTILGGLLPVVLGGLSLPVSALAVPVLLGAVLELVRAGVTLGLPDVRRGHGGVAAALGAVPATVRSGLRLAGRNRIVLRLLLVASTTGVALAVLELVTPAWLEDVTTDAGRAALVYAVVVAAGFGADAVGAAVAPRLRRRLRTPSGAAAAASAVALVAALGLSGASGLLSGSTAVLVAGIAYVGFFVGLGASGPPLGELLHGQVRSEERATVLSVQSLVLQLAGGGGAILAGALTVQLGAWVGFAVAGVALLAAVVLLLRIPARRPAPAQERAQAAQEPAGESA
jgi:predicted MFS family arabinose efflux permease